VGRKEVIGEGFRGGACRHKRLSGAVLTGSVGTKQIPGRKGKKYLKLPPNSSFSMGADEMAGKTLESDEEGGNVKKEGCRRERPGDRTVERLAGSSPGERSGWTLGKAAGSARDI